MSKIAIVTDTISCLPPELIKEYGIRVIPVGLVIDRKVYRDSELSIEKFWELFYAAKTPVTTMAINPADYSSVFTELAGSAQNIVCITVSNLLSATHKAAVQAAAEVMKIKPGLKIEVVDSKTATGAEGFVALEAARAAKAGKDLSEVVRRAEEIVAKVKMVATMSTLKYVVRSGRAPKSAIVGDWLKIKPVLGITTGSGLVENLSKERGMEKAISKMLEIGGSFIDAAKPLHLFVHYSDDLAMGQKIRDTLTSRYQCAEVYLTPYTPVMSSQTGPILSIAFYQ
ncbi:MAG TPA: DegV family protein [Dehalococcoidales bacterium]|nr:DegV family protein [Dehalococcoidales bacterium]